MISDKRKVQGENMKKFENLPVDVQETIKDYLKAFNKVYVYYGNGEYRFSFVLKDYYAPGYRFIGEYYAEDIYSLEERILNYVNEYRSYPIEYKGVRDYSIFKDYNARFIYDNEGNIVVA